MFSHDDIFKPKDIILKKKNSEIENRLFGKTRYYVIAVGKRPLSLVGTKSLNGDEGCIKVRAYIYYNGYICFYNTHGKAYNKREYIDYIDFVKLAVNKNRYEWTNFWIDKGQIISRDSRNNIIIDNALMHPFGEISRVRVDFSDLTLQIYLDSLKSLFKDNHKKQELLQNSFDDGTLRKTVKTRIKEQEKKQINNIDGEIITRTRIEGYNFITSYVKTLINSDVSNKVERVEDFFLRVFYLETNGYILDYRD